MIFCSDYIYGTVTWMSNQHYFLPKARRVLDCKTVRIFAYSSTREQSNKRSGMRLKTESETGERRARKTLTPRFTDFFTDSEGKNRLFCSLAGFKPLQTSNFTCAEPNSWRKEISSLLLKIGKFTEKSKSHQA